MTIQWTLRAGKNITNKTMPDYATACDYGQLVNEGIPYFFWNCIEINDIMNYMSLGPN